MHVLLRINRETAEIDGVVCPVTDEEEVRWPWPPIETRRWRYEIEKMDWNDLTEFLAQPGLNPIVKEKLAGVITK